MIYVWVKMIERVVAGSLSLFLIGSSVSAQTNFPDTGQQSSQYSHPTSNYQISQANEVEDLSDKLADYRAQKDLERGRGICCMPEKFTPVKDIEDGIKLLKRAYDEAHDKEIKAQALYTLGFMSLSWSKEERSKRYNLKEPEEYFGEIMKLLPQGHQLYKDSSAQLKLIKSQKTK